MHNKEELYEALFDYIIGLAEPDPNKKAMLFEQFHACLYFIKHYCNETATPIQLTPNATT